jgi:hypothetical protein
MNVEKNPSQRKKKIIININQSKKRVYATEHIFAIKPRSLWQGKNANEKKKSQKI